MRSWQENVSMSKGILKGPALLITTNHKEKPSTNEGKGGRASLKTPAFDGRKTSFIYANSPGPGCSNLVSAINRIKHYPVDGVVDFHNTYPLDSDLSGG